MLFLELVYNKFIRDKEKIGAEKWRQVIILGAGFCSLEFCKEFSLGEAEFIVIDR